MRTESDKVFLLDRRETPRKATELFCEKDELNGRGCEKQIVSLVFDSRGVSW